MAANTRDIRRRIKSVKNTGQITKAMQMVAAAKMRRAQQAAIAGRPYAQLLEKVMVSLKGRVEAAKHPLLEQREVRKELVVLITTDKGLCGALNTNVVREAAALDKDKTVFVAVGRKGLQFLARTKRDLLAEFPLKDNPTFLEAKAVSKFCLTQFLEGNVDRISVLYPSFVNTLTQRPKKVTLLPATPSDIGHEAGKELDDAGDYLFEPDAASVLDAILPYYVHYEMYQMILEARASEHSARMVAMKSATDNANQLVKDLTLEYNKIRQASITTEILEIATAQVALS
jgi:F-type H+-transporting ATPase subunit gamma